jgi:ribonuclease HI
METAVVVRGKLHHRAELGPGSSERAEWLALLEALSVARTLRLSDIQLLGDSVAVIGQAMGSVRCGENRDCLAAYREQLGGFRRVHVRHVPRTQNLAGIALARMRDGAAGPV